MSDPTSGAGLRYASGRGRLVLAASVAGSGIAFLDSTVVNVALPAIGRSFGTGFSEFQWVINAYLITLGALVLLGGSLGDLMGKRRVFVAGLGLFSVASVACGAAPTIEFLFVARAVQGLGAALLIPNSLAIVQQAFRPRDRGQAIGLWSGLAGLATVVGPFLGGFLVDALSWRWVFFVNPPLAGAAAYLAVRYVPDLRPAEARRPDWLGGALATTGLATIVFALIQGPVWGWTSPWVLAAAAGGALALAAFVAVEWRGDRPMLPLGVFRNRQFTAANVATLPVYGALGGTFFLLTIQLQNNLGYSALEAGAATIPVSAVLLAGSAQAGKLYNTIGPRLPMTVGPLLAGAGVAWLAGVEPGAGYWAGVLPPLATFGAGMTLTVAPLTATALGALADEQSGLASGVNNAMSRIAQLLAVPLLPLAAGISRVDEVMGVRFSDGFSRAMLIAGGVLAAGGVVSWLAVRNPAEAEHPIG